MENEKSPKQKKLFIILGILFLFITVIGVTYSFVNLTVEGTKRQVIKAGTLSLELYEDNEITIAGALPMYDEVGMIQDKVFTFRLVNNSVIDATYTIKLVEVGTGTLSKSDVKYGFTKEGTNTIGLLSDLQNGVIDSGTIAGNKTTINYALRFWIRNDLTDETTISGKSLTYKIDIEVGMEEVQEPSNDKTVTFAGITKDVEDATEAMFNYTSEGCYLDYDIWDTVCEEGMKTNGIYAMEDDDATSYFYRGKVNNLVKFGTYTKDYEVYRYTSGSNTLDFVTLEACQSYNSRCSEDNKVTKYSANDNVPMYWRIIRINGDGTIRMIYAGTTADAIGYDTGIGVSRYTETVLGLESNNGDPKYTGYTYDRTTSEVNSVAKEEIDTWYANVFEGTTYDSQIATGKFCSDSSDYEKILAVDGIVYYAFGATKRLTPSYYNLEGNTSPTFKCATTTETYGGSYNLKAGLITSDEIVAAGGQSASNDSYYLYNGTKGNSDGKMFWSLSPDCIDVSDTYVGAVYSDGAFTTSPISWHRDGLLRPVINLRADVVFKAGTDGSTTTPYEVVME